MIVMGIIGDNVLRAQTAIRKDQASLVKGYGCAVVELLNNAPSEDMWTTSNPQLLAADSDVPTAAECSNLAGWLRHFSVAGLD